MPSLWKVGMLLLVACLLASMAIGIYRLATTPEEILGAGFHGLPAKEPKQSADETAPPRR